MPLRSKFSCGIVHTPTPYLSLTLIFLAFNIHFQNACAVVFSYSYTESICNILNSNSVEIQRISKRVSLKLETQINTGLQCWVQTPFQKLQVRSVTAVMSPTSPTPVHLRWLNNFLSLTPLPTHAAAKDFSSSLFHLLFSSRHEMYIKTDFLPSVHFSFFLRCSHTLSSNARPYNDSSINWNTQFCWLLHTSSYIYINLCVCARTQAHTRTHAGAFVCYRHSLRWTNNNGYYILWKSTGHLYLIGIQNLRDCLLHTS